MIIIDSRFIPDGEVPQEVLRRVFEIHKDKLGRFQKLRDYYDGQQDILNRVLKATALPNNKIVANHAKYISTMATSYVFGKPVSYSGDADYINDIFTQQDEDSHNAELGLDLSIYGEGYELIYMSDDDRPVEKLAEVDPRNAFVVVDETVEHKPQFGVTYYPIYNLKGNLEGYDVSVYTPYEVYTYEANTYLTSFVLTGVEPHFFDGVPLIEYKNNKAEYGDFEGVISLIDAYNLSISDRLNDKEQQVDAILAIIGQSLGDTTQEKSETAMAIKELKMIELDEGGDAKWLTKGLTESDVQVLSDEIKNDIHCFSLVPDLTDENFAANASGIAMKYKLLGLEQLGSEKERYFKKGLRERLQLISNIEDTRSNYFDPAAVSITMKRNLPVDELNNATIAQQTDGLLSWETRLKRFDEDIDPEEERKLLDAEKEEKAKMTALSFGMGLATQLENPEAYEENINEAEGTGETVA